MPARGCRDIAVWAGMLLKFWHAVFRGRGSVIEGSSGCAHGRGTGTRLCVRLIDRWLRTEVLSERWSFSWKINVLTLSPLNKLVENSNATFGTNPNSEFWDFLPILLWKFKISFYIFKQFIPWSEGFYRSPLIWVWTVWKIQSGFSKAGYQVKRVIS